MHRSKILLILLLLSMTSIAMLAMPTPDTPYMSQGRSNGAKESPPLLRLSELSLSAAAA